MSKELNSLEHRKAHCFSWETTHKATREERGDRTVAEYRPGPHSEISLRSDGLLNSLNHQHEMRTRIYRCDTQTN